MIDLLKIKITINDYNNKKTQNKENLINRGNISFRSHSINLITTTKSKYSKTKPLLSEIQSFRNGLQLIISNAQISFGVGNTGMVEFVHDQCQIYATHASMIPPSFS